MLGPGGRIAETLGQRRRRRKEIWVVGADRYRNPDEDVPADFESQRDTYYAALRLPRDGDVFVDGLRNENARSVTDA